MFALAGWMLVYWIETARAVVANYMAIPIWDQWITMFHMTPVLAGNFWPLWEQHNEHRVVFPELLFLLDVVALRGREYLPFLVNALAQLTTWALLSYSLFQSGRVPRKVAIGASLLGGILMGWPGVAFILSAPMCVQWTMIAAASSIALFQIGKAAENTSSVRHLAWAIVAGVVANYTSGNGLFIWPLLIAGGWWTGMRLRRMIFLGCAAVLSTALFFVGYHSAPTLWRIIIDHPIYWGSFIAYFFGMPFGAIGVLFGAVLGCLSCAVLATTVWTLAQADLRTRRAAVLPLGICLLIIATILLISVGRIIPGDWDFTGVKQGRYILIPLLYWTSLIMAAVIAGGGSRITLALLTGFFLVEAARLPGALAWSDLMNNEYAKYQTAALSIEAGLEDPGLIGHYIYPVPGLVHTYLPMMREKRISVFANERYQWLGKPFAALSMTRQERPPAGAIVSKTPVAGGLQIAGNLPKGVEAMDIVLLNGNGTVAGIGEQTKSGWVGFVNFKFAAGPVRAYSMNANRELAPID